MKNAPVSQTGFHSHSHSKSQNTHKNKAKKSRLSPKNACRFQHSANEPVRCQGRIPTGTSGSKSSKSRQSSRSLSGANVFISTQAANMQSSERRYFNSAQNRTAPYHYKYVRRFSAFYQRTRPLSRADVSIRASAVSTQAPAPPAFQQSAKTGFHTVLCS